jgi:ABC-type nitrate/sulfonate/bicarbonate transport system substrate-binding protein
MKKLLIALVLVFGLTTAAAETARATVPVTRIAARWYRAGPYYSARAAYAAARRLQSMGYDAKIVKQGGYWYVYYH